MKKHLPLIFGFYLGIFFVNHLEAQQRYIHGLVKDTTGTGVPYASVVAYFGMEHQVLSAALSDSAGFFQLTLPSPQTIELSVTALGYTDYSTKVSIQASDSLTTMELVLKDADNLLGTVLVTNRRPLVERKIDRTVFNIGSSIVLSSSTVWDALGRVPGVRTESDGNLFSMGKPAVVMIDNRPLQLPPEQVADLLRSLTAADAAAIEVIHTPPAQFDAQGGALINIVLKQQKQAGWNAGMRAAYTQATYPKYMGGALFQFKGPKLALSANYMLRHRLDYIQEKGTIDFGEAYWTQLQNRINTSTAHHYRLAADYTLGSRHSVGVLLDAYNRDGRVDGNTQTDALASATSPFPDSVLYTGLNGSSKQGLHSMNVHYTGKLDTTGTTLTVDLDYTPFSDQRTRDILNTTRYPDGQISGLLFNTRQGVQQDIGILALKSDFMTNTQLLGIPVQVNAGLKWSASDIDNQLYIWQKNNNLIIPGSEQQNDYQYEEKISAGYLSFQGGIQNWQFQIGLRGEYTNINGVSDNQEVFDRGYFQAFPSFYAMLQLNETQHLAVNYGRRIVRPEFWRFNPFQIYQNPYVYTRGNPFLQPAFTNTLEVQYTLGQNYFFALSYSSSKGFISGITIQDNQDRTLVNTYSNLGNNWESGCNISASYSVGTKWESNNYLQIAYKNDQASLDTAVFRFSTWYAYVSSNNIFYLSNDRSWTGEVNAWYGAPSIEGYQRLSENWELSIGVSKKFWEKKASLGLLLTDIFYTNINTTSIRLNDQRSAFTKRTDSRGVTLTFMYRFGDTNMREMKMRKTGSEDEKRRTGE